MELSGDEEPSSTPTYLPTYLRLLFIQPTLAITRSTEQTHSILSRLYRQQCRSLNPLKDDVVEHDSTATMLRSSRRTDIVPSSKTDPSSRGRDMANQRPRTALPEQRSRERVPGNVFVFSNPKPLLTNAGDKSAAALDQKTIHYCAGRGGWCCAYQRQRCTP